MRKGTSKKKISLSIFIVVIVAITSIGFFAACNLDSEPAWKAKTSLSIQLPQYERDGVAARAVIGSSGYIYIATTKAISSDYELYGPYSVNSSRATIINSVSAGVYDSFVVLYSPQEIDFSKEVEGRTLGYYLKEPSIMNAFAQNPNVSENDNQDVATFNTSLQGNESVCLLKDVILKAGEVNSLALTLIPVVHEEFIDSVLDDTPSITIGDNPTPVYISFTEITIPENKQIEISIDDPSAELIAFDSSGKKLPGTIITKDDCTVLILTHATKTIFVSTFSNVQEELTVTFEYADAPGIIDTTRTEFYVGQTAKGIQDGSSAQNCIELNSVFLSSAPWSDMAGPLTFILVEDVVLSIPFSLPGGNFACDDITIKSENSSDKKRLSSSSFSVISIYSAQTGKVLHLKDLIIGPESGKLGNNLINVSSNTIHITNCTLENGGDPLIDGGALYMINATATITNSIIQNNVASTGGGIFVNTGANLNLSGDYLITGNTAEVNGGGVYVNTGSTVTGIVQEENKIKDNTAATGPNYSDGTTNW